MRGTFSSRKHFITIPLRLGNLHLAPLKVPAALGPPILMCLHLQGRKSVYAGSNSGVVQAPVAFCGKHSTCEDCVLARDPYCAWSPATVACVALYQTDGPSRYQMGGISSIQVPCLPHYEKHMHVHTLCPLFCRGLIQEMSGDASACPGKLLILSTLPSGTTSLSTIS